MKTIITYRSFIIWTVLFLFCLGYSIAGEKYSVDKAHSSIGFAVKHMLISTVRGSFTDFSVEWEIDFDNISKSSLNAKIFTKSINTGEEKRDGHLKSPDFFDTENFPEMTFTSKSVKKIDNNYILKGTLTIKGIPKDVEIPFSLFGPVKGPYGKERVGVEGHLTINRQDFNVKWNKTLDNGSLLVDNEVKIELILEGVKI